MLTLTTFLGYRSCRRQHREYLVMPVRTKITRVLILGLRAAWVLSSTVSASAETLEQKQACIADVFEFCAGAIPNRDRISSACHSIIAPGMSVEQVTSQKLLQQNERTNKWPLDISLH